MPQQSDQLTAAQIARKAGVTRATVSNWRRRHPDFPQPSGGTESSPTYDRRAVESWLAARGQLPAPSPADELRTELRKHGPSIDRLLPLVLFAHRMGQADRKSLTRLPDATLLRVLNEAIRVHAAETPDISHRQVRASDVPLLRLLLQSIDVSGAIQTLDLLAERQPTDSSVRGIYYTPDSIADLMADLIDLRPYPRRVLDPACGSGGLLAAAGRRGAGALYGQDISSAQSGQAAVRLAILHPTTEVKVRSGDSLRSDAFPELTVDAVLCNPPFADREWGHNDLGFDPRWEYGLPAKSESELAWVQHCLAHLEPGALAVVMIPPGAAERPGGRAIRTELVRRGTLRAVVALAAGAAPPMHIGLHLWVLQQPASDKTEAPPVLFVDTASDKAALMSATTGGGKTRSSLAAALDRQPKAPDWDSLRDAVLKAWRSYVSEPDNFEPVPGTARTVSVLDLLQGAVDLTPARHVQAIPPTVEPDRHAAAAAELRSQLRRAADGLAALSGGQDWEPAGAEPTTWRTATVVDLTRGGAMTLHRATVAPRNSRATADVPQPASHDDNGLVLTAGDVTAGRPASGLLSQSHLTATLEILHGDVLLPEIFHGAGAARVADDQDHGCLLGPHLLLFRPDPHRLDPWFLAGFLSADENMHGAATGSSIVRVDARRLRVPLMPLDEQRRYGIAFRRIHALRKAADLARRLAAATTRELGTGLTSGSLLPPTTST